MVRELMARYSISAELLLEIIAGMEMDVEPEGYETVADLRLYCHRVASAVGLASLPIFGCRGAACEEYAESLGLALQLTNILRDVEYDRRTAGRVYLPKEDLERFGYTRRALDEKVYDRCFVDLMDFQAERARQFFAAARESLPGRDRRALLAAEVMRAVYESLLRKMSNDRFRVFERSYRISRAGKLTLALGVAVKGLLS